MLSSFTHNRTLMVTGVLFTVAFVICGIAWARFFSVAIVNASPARYMTFVAGDQEYDPFQQSCTGPAFIEANDIAWRFCEYPPGLWGDALAPQWGLVRFDLEEGTGELRWPLPQEPTDQVLALARAETGEMAAAWGSPELSAVTLIRPTGGTLELGLPDGSGPAVSGLAWAGDVLQLVGSPAGDPAGVRLWAAPGGVWDEGRAVIAPESCNQAETLCAHQFAHLSTQGWRFLYAQAPVSVTDPTHAEVAFVLADADGRATPVDTVRLGDLDPDQYRLGDDGRLSGLGALFDVAPGGLVNWSVNAAPFMLHGGTWERVAAPVEDTFSSFYFADYVIESSGALRWIPGLRAPERGWLIDEWLTLRSSGDGIALARFTGQGGSILTTDTAFVQQGGSQTHLLPASTGGYWLLGPNGSYLQVDDDLDRADGLSMVERVRRAYDNFGRLDEVSSEFYREQRTLKMAALPMVLLSLPLGYVLVFFVRQVGKNRRSWLLLLAQISAGYVILATMFIWWFWEIMNGF